MTEAAAGHADANRRMSGADTAAFARPEDNYRRELHQAMQFERLVGEIAARFVNLRPDQLDGAINNAQREIVTALNLDRSSLFEVTGSGDDLILRSYWPREPPGTDPPP